MMITFSLSNSVLVVIEIKPGSFSDGSLESGLREAFVQLIGLSVGNTFHSPVVILTNLSRSHYVLSLEVAAEFPRLKYSLKIQKFKQFNYALSSAWELSKRKCFTKYFGRPPSLPASEKSDEEEETYGNVQLIDGSEGIE